ncbi:hypothetical protein ACFVVX_34030 [Kitasatospora sp. NPDC058170]|uniref:hypothetical protein n=1 Tax=Kitasatospora sp. NPDC058170 TaxID=3346364 RepID=UPI0036D90361
MSNDQSGGAGLRRTLGVGVLVVALVLGGVWFNDLWRGQPFPTADPVAVAGRLDARTQAIYDGLQLPDAPLNPRWPMAGIEASIYDCHPRGLANFPDTLADSPPREPGTAAVHESWALAGVTHAQAADATARARRTLEAAGWKTVSYKVSGGDVALRLEAPGTKDKVAVRAGVVLYPNGNLEVFAAAECVRYPKSAAVDDEGRPDLPDPSAPTQLRSRPPASS